MIKGIGSWITRYSESQADKLAIISGDNYLTYKQFNQRINQLANALNGLGVRKGDRVNVLLFNTNELMETLFACAKLGVIFVPINFRLSPDEVEYVIRDSGGVVFIYDGRLGEVAQAIKTRVTHLRYFLYVGESDQDDLVYEEIVASASDGEPVFDITLQDPHMMMYTSGTTGRPKGALLTHGNTVWNAVNAINNITIKRDDITLTVAPLFHIGGMNILTTPTLYKGGTVVLDDTFHPLSMLEAIEKEKITTVFLVPAMWLALTQVPNFDEHDLSSLRLNISGGAACPITVIEFFQKKGIPFIEGFGLTETAPFVSVLDSENSIRKNGSVGKPPIHTEVRVVNELDENVVTGEVGELIVKGPNVFREYWNMPAETTEAIRDGWFYTGDLAKFDDEDFLYIVDRKKDMIITGGENVYPIEVEQVLFRHPQVKEVGVIGYPDEKWGESVKAVIALKDDNEQLSLADIQSYCDGKLARYKIPKQIEIIEQLPRNATGKVLKNVLRSRTPEKNNRRE